MISRSVRTGGALAPPQDSRGLVLYAWGLGQSVVIDHEGCWWYMTADGAAHYPKVQRRAREAQLVRNF